MRYIAFGVSVTGGSYAHIIEVPDDAIEVTDANHADILCAACDEPSQLSDSDKDIINAMSLETKIMLVEALENLK